MSPQARHAQLLRYYCIKIGLLDREFPSQGKAWQGLSLFHNGRPQYSEEAAAELLPQARAKTRIESIKCFQRTDAAMIEEAEVKVSSFTSAVGYRQNSGC